MQKIIKYIRPLTPVLYQKGNPMPETVQATYQFIEGIRNLPTDKSTLSYKPYYMPYNKAFTGTDYYNILENVSGMLKVRMMWRWLLKEEDGMAVKGIWIIGTFDRVQLAYAYLDWFFNQYWKYHRHLCEHAQDEAKRANYSNVRSYASKLVAIYMHDLNNAIHRKLEQDGSYDLWLSMMIHSMFRLDYKAYSGKNEYYHSTSTKFHHRRMIS